VRAHAEPGPLESSDRQALNLALLKLIGALAFALAVLLLIGTLDGTWENLLDQWSGRGTAPPAPTTPIDPASARV